LSLNAITPPGASIHIPVAAGTSQANSNAGDNLATPDFHAVPDPGAKCLDPERRKGPCPVAGPRRHFNTVSTLYLTLPCIDPESADVEETLSSSFRASTASRLADA
jgi:hypothetical protein